jgi:hypothetical protein
MISLRIPRDQLAERVRGRFGGELRRAGTFAQIGMLGAVACLEAAPRASSLGILWRSTHGAREAAEAALAEVAGSEPVMPFTFVATQPHLLATLLAQHGAPVTRAAFVHVDPSASPILLGLAQAWLKSCEAVLLGYVEEGQPHCSDWRLLRRETTSSA